MESSQLQPLGPAGIRARMEEIRGKIAQLSGEKAPGAAKVGGYSGLSGAITADGTKPYDPMSGGTTISGKPTPSELKGKIEAAARANGVEPALLDALVQAESGYDPTSVSLAGARGLTQLMPHTAVDMGVSNPFDPDQSLHGGAKYLSAMLRQFPKVEDAVAAYNAGPGAVTRHGGIPNYPETRAYVQRVMALYREKKG